MSWRNSQAEATDLQSLGAVYFACSCFALSAKRVCLSVRLLAARSLALSLCVYLLLCGCGRSRHQRDRQPDEAHSLPLDGAKEIQLLELSQHQSQPDPISRPC